MSICNKRWDHLKNWSETLENEMKSLMFLPMIIVSNETMQLACNWWTPAFGMLSTSGRGAFGYALLWKAGHLWELLNALKWSIISSFECLLGQLRACSACGNSTVFSAKKKLKSRLRQLWTGCSLTSKSRGSLRHFMRSKAIPFWERLSSILTGHLAFLPFINHCGNKIPIHM